MLRPYYLLSVEDERVRQPAHALTGKAASADPRYSERLLQLLQACRMPRLGYWEWLARDHTVRCADHITDLARDTPAVGRDQAVLQQWIHPEDRGRLMRACLRCARGRAATVHCLVRVLTGPSEWTWMRLHGAALEGGGQSLGLAGTLYPLSAPEIAAAAPALAPDQDAAQRAKNIFLANMGHEIRTPLNGILAMSELVMAEPLPEHVREMVSLVHGGGRWLLRILNDVLDYSRAESGKMLIDSVPFDLKQLMLDLVAAGQANAQRNVNSLSLDYPEALPRYFEGDPLRLRQVLSNLLNNALKFTQQGQVSVRVSLQHHPAMAQHQHTVVFRVQDSGIGMSPATLQRIWTPFEQAAAANSQRQFGGAGLGLSLSQRLAEVMGGTLVAHSRESFGSEFRLTLPLGVVATDTDQRLHDLVDRIELPAGDQGTMPDMHRNLQWDAFLAEQFAPGLATGIPTGTPKSTPNGTLCDGRTDEPASFAALKPKHEPASADSDAERAGLRVLVAEDTRVNQVVMTQMLKLLGHEAVVVADGAAAVAAYRAGRFDVVLMDVQMPVLDGIEATRQIRAFESAAARTPTPVVAVTANTLPWDQTRCHEAGMNRVLSKPISRARLAESLSRALPTRHSGACS